ncbi:unnamed protein product [Cylindrotheca closterium]|uniref:NACHT domain-containing protein n=1 Tax=Cylindrotheca closterium TaxID=2856 RepID=A0AAD2G223_9STRA|nr:unnamed protein product [Cylindrotheca closterium]
MQSGSGDSSSRQEEEPSRQYLSDLAARVKTIKDDILDEELDVETQLIRVSTSAVSWKSFSLKDLEECIALMGEGIIWERCETGDLQVGDLIQTRDATAVIQIQIALVQDVSRRSEASSKVEPEVLLRSGNRTFIQDIGGLEIWKSKKQLSFEECIRLQDTAVSWRELPGVWELKAGDVIRDVARGIPVAKLTARPVEHYRFLYLAIMLPDGTEQKYETDKRTIERVLNVPVGISSATWRSVDNVDDVCRGVMKTSDPVLMVAGPGTGKTWFLQQLCCRLVKEIQSQGGISVVPILIPVQKLARILRQNHNMRGMELLHGFLEMDYPQYVSFLTAKLEAQGLILLIDGVDEAAGKRQTIEEFIHDFLKPTGNRIVVTSRPEGVRLPLYCQDFSIIKLLPLSPEQQISVIQHFLKEDEFLSSLFKLSNVRRGHDNVFNTAFDRNERMYVESLCPSDNFKLEDGSWDPSKRQKALDGSDLCVASSLDSSYLQLLQEAMEAHDILCKLEDKLRAHFETSQVLKVVAAENMVDKILPKDGLDIMNGYSDLRTVCIRLCLLYSNTQRNKMPLKKFWNHIASRVDALYVSAGHFSPLYEKWLATIQAIIGEEELQIHRGSIKDPIRVYEKAQNDYANRFDDDSLPEACVMDVLRARLICRSAEAIKKIMRILQKDENVVAMEQDSTTVVRLKNMFHHGQLTPTHFRFKIATLQLVDGNTSFLVEVQLHLDAIMKHEESADGHAAYEYFRSVLKERYHAVLGNALESPRIEDSLTRFEAMAKVPVLLSLIVVILFRGGVEDPLAALQWSTIELYENSMECVVHRAVKHDKVDAQIVTTMLTKVSVANMRAQRRVFDMNEVKEAFAGEDNSETLFQKWLELQDKKGGVPLIKTLSESTTYAKGGLYQFKHLSFSEAFYYRFLTSGDATVPAAEALTVISDPFYHRTCEFGRSKIMGVLHSGYNYHKPLAESLKGRLQER